MGDPSGVGGEIALKAWTAGAPPFVMLADPDWLAAIDPSIPVREAGSLAEAEAMFPTALPVLAVQLAATAAPGRPDTANAAAITSSIRQAVTMAQAGHVSAVVTNPIAKHVLYAAGFHYPGHTEFLGALTDSKTPVMMLVNRYLRVVPVTVHLGLRAALDRLSTESIVTQGRIVADTLRARFGIAAPRLAVAGLNPHAGEGGAMGNEEQTLIMPAIVALQAAGIDAQGPYPPDTMFTEAARAGYDAALCMYHDQALIPLKTLDMASGVNVTLGLPIVRTSPDHGTAFDIAGQGRADPSSLLAALRLAAEMGD